MSKPSVIYQVDYLVLVGGRQRIQNLVEQPHGSDRVAKHMTMWQNKTAGHKLRWVNHKAIWKTVKWSDYNG